MAFAALRGGIKSFRQASREGGALFLYLVFLRRAAVAVKVT
jgi:hypothetical protein